MCFPIEPMAQMRKIGGVIMAESIFTSVIIMGVIIVLAVDWIREIIAKEVRK